MTAEDAPAWAGSGASREWLETDGRGGFASGTADLVRTRRYHALLLRATEPPAGRVVLVNGIEAWVETSAGRFAISGQLYGEGVEFPDGRCRIASFTPDPWPRWTFLLEDGTAVEQEILVSRAAGVTVLAWRALGNPAGVSLDVRPLLSGRDYHALHHENPALRFEARTRGGAQTFRPYPGIPEIAIHSSGDYIHDPLWYRDFLYTEERERGLDCREDLASPGRYRFDLSRGEAILLLESGAASGLTDRPARMRAAEMRESERKRRAGFPSRLERAAGDYIVARGRGKTVVAGYPWFTDWGRDTFISLRGLCLATGRLSEARDILVEWAGWISSGMLPNRFPDKGETPEFNSVDASLWYVVAVHEYFAATRRRGRRIPISDRNTLGETVARILDGYCAGTRYGIRADDDGLLSAGVPGVALTWMDAKVGEHVVTPRIGKPVEVQALWINALSVGSLHSERWSDLARRAREAFHARFWREEIGCLFDVVDCDHVTGTADPAFRPNQIFAVGGLPFSILSKERGRRVVDAVEKKLWTPLGLRSLAPDEPAYVGRYAGGAAERDGAYHQGTVWPWLIGPFVEAWVRVRDDTPAVRREARERFLQPILSHLDAAGLGHVCEIADGDFPHRPRGCPYQAWSTAETLRLDLDILREREKMPERRPAPPAMQIRRADR